MNITQLPAELVINTLLNLRAPDIVSICSTSRFFREILLTSTALRFLVELEKHGIGASASLGSLSLRGLSPEESLCYLRKREENWRHARFKHIVIKPFQGPGTCVKWTIENGYLVMCRCHTESTSNGSRLHHTLSFTRLPQCTHNQNEVSSLSLSLQLGSADKVLDFKISMQHDLLVVLIRPIRYVLFILLAISVTFLWIIPPYSALHSFSEQL